MHAMFPVVLSPNFYTAPIGGTCGGLLCDAMGLGWVLGLSSPGIPPA